MTMITPSYLGETIEYSSLHACRSTLEDPTEYLKKPIRRLSTPDVHIPFSPVLEKPLFPGKDAIVAAIRGLL